MIRDTHKTVHDVFRGTVEAYADRPLFNTLPSTAEIYGIGAGEITFAQAAAQVEAWAERLAAAGYGTGMRVGLLLANRPEFFIIWLALNRLGASVVPINPDLRSGELEYM
ncbi:MAG: AMP-binding protein, partial [Rhizobiaceae bacterium]